MPGSDNDVLKKIIAVAAIAATGYVLYRIMAKDESPVEAVEKTVEKTVKAPIEMVKVVSKRLTKGSSEAKYQMAKLASMRKNVGRKKSKYMTKAEYKSRFKSFVVGA